MWMWISGESCKKQETKEGDIFLRLFGSNIVRWRSGPDGTNTKEHHGHMIRRPLQEMDGGKQAWDSLRNG